MYRNCNCGMLTIKDVEKEVILAGWVQKIRNLGSMIFIDLRDEFGITQVVVSNEIQEKYAKVVENVVSECVIRVTGKVVERSNKNTKIP